MRRFASLHYFDTKLDHWMEKFLLRFNSLSPDQQDIFIRGLLAGFWGDKAIQNKGIPAALLSWKHSRKWHGLTQEAFLQQFFQHISSQTPLANLSYRTLDNIFSKLNQALEAAIPLLPKLLPKPAARQELQVATHWLDIGDASRADTLLHHSQGTLPQSEEDIEAWYHFHRAYYNLIIRVGAYLKESEALNHHFDRMRFHNDTLMALRSLRIECAAASLAHPDERRTTWHWREGAQATDSFTAPAIKAFENCLRWLINPDSPQSHNLWLQTWHIIQSEIFPKHTTEFRELARYLLNQAFYQINRHPDKQEWYQHAFELFSMALQQGALLVNGYLPAQHLVNYCSIAIHVQEMDALATNLNRWISELSPKDIERGEDKFCKATLDYANGDYQQALITLETYKSNPQRRLALYVLKMKVLVECGGENTKQADALINHLDKFSKWLSPKSRNLAESRRVLEWERLSLVRRLMNIQWMNKSHQRNLWKDIQRTLMDRPWLEKMFIRRFGRPNDETQEHYK